MNPGVPLKETTSWINWVIPSFPEHQQVFHRNGREEAAKWAGHVSTMTRKWDLRRKAWDFSAHKNWVRIHFSFAFQPRGILHTRAQIMYLVPWLLLGLQTVCERRMKR